MFYYLLGVVKCVLLTFIPSYAMENSAQTTHAIAIEATELIFTPSKKNGPKSVVQKNVMCIFAGFYFHFADRNSYCTGANCCKERNVLAFNFKCNIIFF